MMDFVQFSSVNVENPGDWNIILALNLTTNIWSGKLVIHKLPEQSVSRISEWSEDVSPTGLRQHFCRTCPTEEKA